MFRIANARNNQLIEAEAKLTLGRTETHNGISTRKFYPLNLERNGILFFPLHWTIVHPIDEESPFYGLTKEEFDKSNPEIFILLTATDETFSQTVHSRSSYRHNEVIWNAKFADMFNKVTNGKVSVDLKRIHLIEKV